MSRTTPRRRWAAVGSVAAAALLIAGCTSNEAPAETEEGDESSESSDSGSGGSANDEVGETVTIGFSGPAAGHGWMGAITQAAEDEAAQFEDV